MTHNIDTTAIYKSKFWGDNQKYTIHEIRDDYVVLITKYEHEKIIKKHYQICAIEDFNREYKKYETPKSIDIIVYCDKNNGEFKAVSTNLNLGSDFEEIKRVTIDLVGDNHETHT